MSKENHHDTIPVYNPTLDKEQAKENVRDWVNRFMRVTISDGRVFIGRFVCVDNQKNIILSEATEYRKTGCSSK